MTSRAASPQAARRGSSRSSMMVMSGRCALDPAAVPQRRGVAPPADDHGVRLERGQRRVQPARARRCRRTRRRRRIASGTGASDRQPAAARPATDGDAAWRASAAARPSAGPSARQPAQRTTSHAAVHARAPPRRPRPGWAPGSSARCPRSRSPAGTTTGSTNQRTVRTHQPGPAHRCPASRPSEREPARRRPGWPGAPAQTVRWPPPAATASAWKVPGNCSPRTR